MYYQCTEIAEEINYYVSEFQEPFDVRQVLEDYVDNKKLKNEYSNKEVEEEVELF